MAEHTKIEWTDATWNPVTGCSVVSPGCTNCYAMKLAGGRLRNHPSREGLTMATKAGPVWNGQVRFNEDWLRDPLRWRKPRMIFVCAHGDLFHEAVPDQWIDRVFAVMALCPQHTFQVLTKRPERMRAYVSEVKATWCDRGSSTPGSERIHEAALALTSEEWLPETPGLWPLPNVWLGVSVEDQARANERVPILLDTPAAVRWISAEPLLGPVDLTELRQFNPSGKPWIDGLRGLVTRGDYLARSPSECSMNTSTRIPGELPSIDWIVAGGESGRDARPMHPDWARSLRDQCVAAGVPFLFKQWGEWLPDFEDAPSRPDDDPEQSRFETCVWDVESQRWETTNGSWDDGDQWETATDYWQPEQPMTRVGKASAGRTFEGVIWDQYPTSPSPEHTHHHDGDRHG